MTPEFDHLGFSTRAGLQHPFQLGEGVYRFEFDYTFRLRGYTNVTPSIAPGRQDRIHAARFRVAWNVTELTELRLDQEHTHSNLPSIDYRQNVVGLSFALDP